MDFDQAVSAHVGWKIKLRTAIAAKAPVDAASVARDDRCALGLWLHGDARAKYGRLGVFEECVGAHAAFHREAGKVARMIDERRYDAAAAALSGESYAAASNRAIVAINKLKRETAAPA